jgi:hypothetical protein
MALMAEDAMSPSALASGIGVPVAAWTTVFSPQFAEFARRSGHARGG